MMKLTQLFVIMMMEIAVEKMSILNYVLSVFVTTKLQVRQKVSIGI